MRPKLKGQRNESYVDSTGFARITTFMRDESGDKLPKLTED
jgi:hypothetical protein